MRFLENHDIACKIEVLSEFTAQSQAVLSMLYSPLIGNDAIVLYHTLIAIGTRNIKVKNHRLILQLTGMSQAVFEKNRKILEQFLLVKTFYNASDHSYIYQIFMPKDGNTFLRHEVFGRFYLKKLGKQVYEFSKLCFAYDIEDKQGYQDISTPFAHENFQSWQDQEEQQFISLKPKKALEDVLEFPIQFNFDRFLTDFSYTVFPRCARNERNLKIIGELATIHGVDEMKMRTLVSKSMNLKDGTLNIEALKKKVRGMKDDWKKEVVNDPYQLPPVRFLQEKQHGIMVSQSDKYLIESLIHDFKMKPEVVNVLIEYVLSKTNQRFTKSYVETVASAWIRLKIDTKEKALDLISEESKEKKLKRIQRKEVTRWYDDQDSIQKDDEVHVDDDELQRLMAQLRGDD